MQKPGTPKVISLTDTLIALDSLHLHAEPYYVKGLYYSNAGAKEKAIQSFNETIKRNYNYLNAYIERGGGGGEKGRGCSVYFT